MEISRYTRNNIRTIEVRGQQGSVYIFWAGEGQAAEVIWLRQGRWKEEQALLDLKERGLHAEPFIDLLMKGLEIAQKWRHNPTYDQMFSAKSAVKISEMRNIRQSFS